jgi:MFS family permease
MNGAPGTSDNQLLRKPQEQPSSVRWRILALLFAFSFMSWFNRVSMSVAGDEYLMLQYQNQIDETDMGIVYSALLFTYTLFMTPGGWFIDRFGAWAALAIMGFGSALFGMLTGMLGWFLLSGTALWIGLIGIRACMGLFTAPIYPASGKIIARWFPFPQQALANGLVIGAALVGIAATFEGFGSLIDLFGWEKAFIISGGITAFLALLWVVYAREHPSQHPAVNQGELDLILFGTARFPSPEPSSTAITAKPHLPPVPLKDLAVEDKSPVHPAGVVAHRADWLVLLRNRSLVLLTFSYAAVGYFEYLFYFWIRHYFQNELKLDKADSRMAATIANLAMAGGMFLGGWLSDLAMRRFGYRLGRALVPVAGMLASAGLLLLGIAAQEPEWVVVWFSLAMAAVGASEGPFWATAIDLGGRRGATSAGIFNTGGNAGGILSPVVTPLVGDSFGWNWAIGLASAVCLGGVTLWFWIDPRERCPEE